MRDVAIIGIAQTDVTPGDPDATTHDLVYEVARGAVADAGMDRRDIDFTVSGSSDMLEGRSFNFVQGLEALGAYPAIHESHVEMDGAWAAWYAWIKILAGEADSALALSWARTSEGSLHHVLNTQLDPFTLGPLGLDHIATGALQADAWMARTGGTLEQLDAVVERARDDGARNPTVRELLEAPVEDGPVASPLHRRHCSVTGDGACALVLAAEDVARSSRQPGAWIAGADQRTETAALGHRDLSRLDSAQLAAQQARIRAGWADADVDVAELTTAFAHQEPLLTDALQLDGSTSVNPSGGPLVADPIVVTGLIRLAEAALQVTGRAGDRQVPGAQRALAHAGAGHALQQNLVWLLEGDRT